MKKSLRVYITGQEYEALRIRAGQVKTSISDLARTMIVQGLNDRLAPATNALLTPPPDAIMPVRTARTTDKRLVFSEDLNMQDLLPSPVEEPPRPLEDIFYVMSKEGKEEDDAL